MAKQLPSWNVRCVPWEVNRVQSAMEIDGAVYGQQDDLGLENHFGVQQRTKATTLGLKEVSKYIPQDYEIGQPEGCIQVLEE